jgi:hypothetical protein
MRLFFNVALTAAILFGGCGAALAKGKIPSPKIYSAEWAHVAYHDVKRKCHRDYGENQLNKNDQSKGKYFCAVLQHSGEWAIRELEQGKEWWKTHVPSFAKRGEAPE